MSAFTRLEDATELQAIFEQEKSEVTETAALLPLKKSSSTLQAVKHSIHKHISRDLSRIKRRSLFFRSEDAPERNQDVALLRERIPSQELSDQRCYDDDAKSLSTMVSNMTPEQKQHHTTAGQKAVSVASRIYDVETAPETFVLDPGMLSPKQKFPVRRHSFAEFGFSDLADTEAPENMLRRESWIPCLPPAPLLKPRQASSIIDPALRRPSWRLSFAAENRSSQLRALHLEQKRISSVPILNDSMKDIKRLEWFRSQGLGQPPVVLNGTSLWEGAGVDLEASGVSRVIDDCGGVDGSDDILRSPPDPQETSITRQLSISRQMISKCLRSSTSSPQLSVWEDQSEFDGDSPTLRLSESLSSPFRLRQSVSSPAFQALSSECYHVPPEGASSFDGGADEARDIRHTSRSSSYTLDIPEEPKLRWDTSPAKDAPSANNGDSSTQVPPQSSRYRRKGSRYTLDESSYASETPSYWEREKKIEEMNARFPNAQKRPNPTIPLKSKFVEDFGDDEEATPPSRVQTMPFRFKSLQLPRITKLQSRSYDGAGLELQIPEVRVIAGSPLASRSNSNAEAVSPSTTMSPSNSMSPSSRHSQSGTERSHSLRHPSPVSAHPGTLHVPDSMESVWKDAVHKTHERMQERRSSRRNSFSGGLQFLGASSWRFRRNSSSVSNAKPARDSVVDAAERERIQALRAEARRLEEERRMEEEWEEELAARELQAQAKTAALKQVQTPRSLLPPRSWARFLSDTRAQRTGSAGAEDHVQAKDFAIKEVKEDGSVEWYKGSRKYHHHHHEREHHHSLPTRISNQLRTQLYKLRSKKATMKNDTMQGRKSSVSVGGMVEYPELELLPGEVGAVFNEVEEIERETEMRLRLAERQARTRLMTEALGGGYEDGPMSPRDEREVFNEFGVNIANPMFYDDCVDLPILSDTEVEDVYEDCVSMPLLSDNDEEEWHSAQKGFNYRTDLYSTPGSVARGSRQEKSKTWGGVSTPVKEIRGLLRASTMDFQAELEKLEKLERERVLRAAEEAWGSVKR